VSHDKIVAGSGFVPTNSENLFELFFTPDFQHKN
jgi:hypothetical protein